MTPNVRKLYDEAKLDTEFHSELKKAKSTNKIPTWLSDEIDQHIFATVYYGWLIGKDKFKKLKQLEKF